MSYMQAPSTKMLATYCAICSRPLRDAKSVEIGIGPTCRERYGYSEVEGLTEEVRVEANKLIHAVACDQDGPKVIPAVQRLMELKLVGIVTAILERVAKVKIAPTADGKELGVKAPYSEEALTLFRKVPGRRWDKETKTTRFSVLAKRELFVALTAAYPGAIALGPKGLFVLVAASQEKPLGHSSAVLYKVA